MSDGVGGCASSGFQIVNEDSYEDAVLNCGGHQFVDEALCMVDEALNKYPLGFQALSNSSDVRFAKTKLRISKGTLIPAMTVFFTVDAERRIVRKLHVKWSSPEEMAFADNPWDSDEPPF